MKTSRRTLLVGGLGALGATALAMRDGRAKGEGTKGKNLVVVFVAGGWDITYALDPKPGVATIDAPAGARETVGGVPIFTHPSRPAVRRFFEAYGPLLTVVNGIQVQSINHPDCSKRMLTGTASETNPDFAAITAYELGRDLPAPYLALGATAYTGPLGSIAVRTGSLTQLKSLLDPSLAFPEMDAAASRFASTKDEAALIRDYVEKSAERERSTRGARGYNARRLDDFVASVDRGERFKSFKEAFPKELSFALDLRVQIDLALRALGEGLSRSVLLEGALFGWDTHSANEAQGPLHEALYEGLTVLADELDARPGATAGHTLLDETVVAVVSEMGRSPKLNAEQGKDHWPVTSAIVFGGGLPGGRAIGASGDRLEAKPIDLVSGAPSKSGRILEYGSFVAGMLAAVGVDPAAHFPGTEVLDALVG